MFRGIALCAATVGLTLDYWLRCSREERDAIWEAKLFLVDRERERRDGRAGG